MNIIKMYMNNVIILILAVRICEDSDTRGSDKRGYTVDAFSGKKLILTKPAIRPVFPNPVTYSRNE